MKEFHIEKWFENNSRDTMIRFYVRGHEVHTAYYSDHGMDGLIAMEQMFHKTARALGHEVVVEHYPKARTCPQNI